MKTTVIFHSADFDGLFCREIARKFLPEAELIGWNFGDPSLCVPDGMIYVMDLPVDKVFGFDYTTTCMPTGDGIGRSRTVWIDHHKSSIESHPTDIPGYRIDGVAACRLAWQWFSADHTDFVVQCNGLPDKLAFVARKVAEPLAVRLAGEYDIWDKRDPRAEEFQFGLRGQDLNAADWKCLLQITGDGSRAAEILCDQGKRLHSYQQKIDADLVTHRSYRLNWEGLNFIVLNTGRFNSLTFAALDKPETGHDALLGYMFNGKCWTVSLYHAKHRTDLDLSSIAVKHGGGGHRGAAGYTCQKLPFSPPD